MHERRDAFDATIHAPASTPATATIPMVTHRKVVRFRMKPNAAQREALGRMAGARRYVWNWAPIDGAEATTRNRTSLSHVALVHRKTANQAAAFSSDQVAC
jgi:hypothetical protein